MCPHRRTRKHSLASNRPRANHSASVRGIVCTHTFELWLFPALRRLEENGWASGYWDVSENNRKARYYAITKAGQKQLARERQDWKSITMAVEKVLEGA